MRPWLPNSAVRDKKVSSLPAECVLLLTVVVTHKFNNFSRVIVRITPRSRGDLAKVNKPQRSALNLVNFFYFVYFFLLIFHHRQFSEFPAGSLHFYSLTLFLILFFFYLQRIFLRFFYGFPQFYSLCFHHLI